MVRIKRPFIISFAALMTVCAMLMAELYTLLLFAIAVIFVLFLFFLFRKAPFCKVLLLLFAFSAAGLLMFTASDTVREKENALAGYGKEISGTVSDITLNKNGSVKSAVLSDCTVDNTRVFSKLSIFPDEYESFSYGDRLIITTNEIFVSEGDGIFRFHSISDRCRLSCLYQTKNRTVTKADDTVFNRIIKLREYSERKLSEALSDEAAAVSQALFTGSRDAVSPELSCAFRICGISHIFAVSGMHLSLWTGIFFLILKRHARLMLLPNLLAIFFVIFYVIFTGFSPSVLRAGIMLITVFTGRIIKRRSDALNTLGLSGTVLLLTNPFLAGNVSFLLSFIATAAIALRSEHLLPEKRVFHGLFRRIKRKIYQPFYDTVTSAAVIIATLPVVSVFFGYFSLMAPFSSIIITPLAEGIMILSSLIVLLPRTNILHTAAAELTEVLSTELTKTAERLSEAEFMLLPADSTYVIPIFTVTAVLSGIFLIIYSERRKALISILSAVIIFLSLTAYDYSLQRDNTELKIFGKENATLISLTADAGRKSLIIGAGGTFSLASELVRDLNSMAIAKADLLFIPREKLTENKNTEYLRNTLQPHKTVLCYDYASDVTVDVWDGCRIYGKHEEGFSAAALSIYGTKIVICPCPTVEFTSEHNEFLSGDILICRSNIPETLDTDAFSDVIIINKTAKKHLSDFIQTSGRSLTITFKGDSYAVY